MSIPQQPWAIVPGNHDGVHRGHQHLLDLAKAEAGKLPVVPLFFDPHPAKVLRPEAAPTPLTTVPRRIALLMKAGASHVVCRHFDHELAALTPDAFVRQVLSDKLGAKLVVTGPDFRFGHRRSGDVDTLRQLGQTLGFEVRVADLALEDGQRISSTWIRARLRQGDVVGAANALGRFHEAEATVVQGQQRGRTIGFPTANLNEMSTLLPADGVYSVVARVVDADVADASQTLWCGAANLGVRPTLAAGRSLEVHLLDLEASGGALYGKRLRIGFVDRIRDERKFDGIDALKRQIALDVDAARASAGQALKKREMLQWF